MYSNLLMENKLLRCEIRELKKDLFQALHNILPEEPDQNEVITLAKVIEEDDEVIVFHNEIQTLEEPHIEIEEDIIIEVDNDIKPENDKPVIDIHTHKYKCVLCSYQYNCLKCKKKR